MQTRGGWDQIHTWCRCRQGMGSGDKIREWDPRMGSGHVIWISARDLNLAPGLNLAWDRKCGPGSGADLEQAHSKGRLNRLLARRGGPLKRVCCVGSHGENELCGAGSGWDPVARFGTHATLGVMWEYELGGGRGHQRLIRHSRPAGRDGIVWDRVGSPGTMRRDAA